MTPIIPYEFEVIPTPERVQARKDASKWAYENGANLEGWQILGLETILITGIIPGSLTDDD